MKELITKSDVGNILKYSRLQNKLSIEEVAASLKAYGYELAPRSLYNYESGLSMPPVNMFLVLCRIYGLEDLIPKDGMPEIKPDEREKMLIEYFRAASPEVQTLTLKMLKPED